MLMNTKGYTLIELLAVIVVLSLASILIIGISSKSLDNNKKQNFVNNAVNAVSKAKLYYNTKTYNGDENGFNINTIYYYSAFNGRH